MMETALNEIIIHGATLERSINTYLLHQHTKMLTGVIVKKIRWNTLKRLFILESDQYFRETHDYADDLLLPGAYTDDSGEWALIVGVDYQKIQEYLHRCTSRLETLEVRFTPILELDVGNLSGLRKLTLDYNQSLVEVRGLERLTKLEKLDLSNTGIGPVLNLDELLMLDELRLDRTYISSIQLSSELPKLHSFHARYSNLEDTEFLRFLPAINTLDLANTNVTGLLPLDNLIKLEQLYVSGTPLECVPQLKHLEQLKLLNLSSSSISSLEGVTFPEHLAYLDLSGTTIRHLPDSIGTLQDLQTLDLSDMLLEHLPDWLLDLGLEFSLDWGSGIRLRNTRIAGVDMSIFSQPREMIAQWIRERNTRSNPKEKLFGFDVGSGDLLSSNYIGSFRSGKTLIMNHMFNSFRAWTAESVVGASCGGSLPQEIQKILNDFHTSYDPHRINLDFGKRPALKMPAVPEPTKEDPAPLNEIKVVFLGDGEAGKSHIIARLLNDGQQAKDFPGTSTPGIVIQNKTYDIGGRSIQVHFWDFGGQEILHSMHRMFLTIKTLYVVVLNVREGNQDERARYWFHNIRSFANGAPVLLVLNKMDMNRNASINERDLREMYPKLTEIVKMSALTDSTDSVKNNLIAALNRQIRAFDILESPFLPAWNRLKERLQNMETPYIRGKQYAALSAECGVENNDNIQKALLEWFSNLGISFHYGDSAKLDDYVVLRPDWITNAVYIIIFNKMDEVKNGLVSHEAIYHLLNPSPEDADTVKRAIPDTVYEVGEVEYVLNVIRKFRLSFQVDDKTEFIPMLCDGNSAPVAEEYTSDPLTLEFRMEYDYLPNNVLHRLMVDRHRDLDQNNVWLTGARFVYGKTGLSAVVKSEGNLLRIMVRAEKARYTADMYLDLLKDDLERINTDMGLCVKEMQVAYKTAGIVEFFNHKMLLSSQAAGINMVVSLTTMKPVLIRDILMQTDYRVDENRKRLILDIARACEKMQDNRDNWDKNEDSRTTYIRDILSAQKYVTLDQHRSGTSETGKQAGELDLDIRLESDVAWTIFEALNIRGQGKAQLKNWDRHLRKLLDNYNATGRPFLFHVSYVECPKDRFLSIYKAFYSHLNVYSPTGFTLQMQFTKEISLAPSGYMQNQFIRAAECVYDCGGASMTVYHYFVRVGA